MFGDSVWYKYKNLYMMCMHEIDEYIYLDCIISHRFHKNTQSYHYHYKWKYLKIQFESHTHIYAARWLLKLNNIKSVLQYVNLKKNMKKIKQKSNWIKIIYVCSWWKMCVVYQQKLYQFLFYFIIWQGSCVCASKFFPVRQSSVKLFLMREEWKNARGVIGHCMTDDIRYIH